jgi:hypothetical protein
VLEQARLEIHRQVPSLIIVAETAHADKHHDPARGASRSTRPTELLT